jgi:hypothetical protein
MFHISWAKSRGDFEDSKKMVEELKAVDKVFIS